MKTASCWGAPPDRIYHFINGLPENIKNICVVGCSDGKFVMPFLRKNYTVTAIDLDKIALYGGVKHKPVSREKIEKKIYVSSEKKPVYHELPMENVTIDGLLNRCVKEKLTDKLNIIETNFYRSPPNEKYDVLFTSCSLQYKTNRDIPVTEIMDVLMDHVNDGGFLYMDYMMPLEDRHIWKSPHYFRTGQIRRFFDDKWDIKYIYEMKHPIFEAAHIDRAEDHFHRFGYILARKRESE